jgi:hypothetical protein
VNRDARKNRRKMPFYRQLSLQDTYGQPYID